MPCPAPARRRPGTAAPTSHLRPTAGAARTSGSGAAGRPFQRRGRRLPAAGRAVAPRGAAESGSAVPGCGNRPEGAPAAPRQPRAERGASQSRGAAALSSGAPRFPWARRDTKEILGLPRARRLRSRARAASVPPRARPRSRPPSARAEPLLLPCAARAVTVLGALAARAVRLVRGAASSSRPEPSERRVGPALPVSRAVPRGGREAAVARAPCAYQSWRGGMGKPASYQWWRQTVPSPSAPPSSPTWEAVAG
ncbi:beta/gamma crystallin domain-containing protein 2-like [Phasianus colchicus]|uniref:beta/gamma crystallin domain-containing protein 2-like n=1 Tax=Phasianus colchicus TaxID=9054 RepID=UPI00129DED2B|nr:beta/gamma crystallin domain-containing protein 2-like [Phasianus colchicus]